MAPFNIFTWVSENWKILTTIGTIIVGGLIFGIRVEARVLSTEKELQNAQADIQKLSRKYDEMRDALQDVRFDIGMLCAAQFGPENCRSNSSTRRQP